MEDQIIKSGHVILDSMKKGSTQYYKLRCTKCGYESIRTNGFLNAKALCPKCSGGRYSHNARKWGKDPLWERYWTIKRRLKSEKGYQGLTMCDEWEKDFPAFREWALSHGYKEGLTIDRIDNEKGYSPDNCRWVTPKQQANNRRSNVWVEYDGKRFTLSQLSDYVQLPRNTIKRRYESGWNTNDIAKTPYKSRKKWSEMNEQQSKSA